MLKIHITGKSIIPKNKNKKNIIYMTTDKNMICIHDNNF